MINGTPVSVYVASINTRNATELCIRSIAKYTDRDAYTLTVGDCGSTDSTIPMLARLRKQGLLDHLEIALDGRAHAEWLDKWTAECPTQYAVILDSDVELKHPDWLPMLLAKMRDTGVGLTCAEILPELANYVDYTGVPRRLAARPSAWVLAMDTAACRKVDVSWKPRFESDDSVPEGFRGYDTGAFIFSRLRDSGHRVEEAGPGFGAMFIHYGGMSWVKREQRYPSIAMKLKRVKTDLLGGYLYGRRLWLRAVS